jgi:hypothetical protein
MQPLKEEPPLNITVRAPISFSLTLPGGFSEPLYTALHSRGSLFSDGTPTGPGLRFSRYSFN